MFDPSSQLPPEVMQSAHWNGSGFAWHTEEVPAVIEAVRLAGLSTCGGTLQYIIPIGTCELYWICFETYELWVPQQPWVKFVEKSAQQSSILFADLRDRFDFRQEAIEAWPAIRELADGGHDLGLYERFELEIESEESLAKLAEMGSQT